MKYWKDCSKQERNEVRRIADNVKYAKDKRIKGKITKEEHLKILNDLEKKLEEVKEKYE